MVSPFDYTVKWFVHTAALAMFVVSVPIRVFVFNVATVQKKSS